MDDTVGEMKRGKDMGVRSEMLDKYASTERWMETQMLGPKENRRGWGYGEGWDMLSDVIG